MEKNFFLLPQFYENAPACMGEEGWYVGLGHEGGCLREGGKTVLNSLKGGGIKKEEKGKKVGGESRVCQVM